MSREPGPQATLRPMPDGGWDVIALVAWKGDRAHPLRVLPLGRTPLRPGSEELEEAIEAFRRELPAGCRIEAVQ